MPQPAPGGEPAKVFSLPKFAAAMVLSLGALYAVYGFLLPSACGRELGAAFWQWAAVFVLISAVNCFAEYFFHRYLLHTSAVPLLRRLYRQHTLHHALTRIARKPSKDGRGLLFVENVFPIVEPEQHEASFFPWYALVAFAAAFAPLFVGLHFLAPGFPWVLAGLCALATSLTLYELLHAANHWPLETWRPLLEHPRWGRFWRLLYSFHLRHHAVIGCNESISGFFGLPLADWAFRTCVIPDTVYADGEDWTPEKFSLPPHPVWLIRKLDALAQGAMRSRRAAAAPEALPVLSLGERIAGGVTQGVCLTLGIAGLTLLIALSSIYGDAWHVVSFTVFGLTLLALHAAATLQQIVRSERSRWFFENLRRSTAYLLIAGTYTPVLLTNLRGPWGWSLFGVLWGLCGAGAVFQLIFGRAFSAVSQVAYFLLGGLIVIAARPMILDVPHGGLWLLLAGCLCYAAGLVLHNRQHLRYRQACWSGCFAGGGVCHLLAVLLFLLPR